MSRVSDKRLRFTRDGVLFMAGLLGIGYETAISQTDRPTLLLLFGAMIGLPAFLNKDEKNQEKEDDNDDGRARDSQGTQGSVGGGNSDAGDPR